MRTTASKTAQLQAAPVKREITDGFRADLLNVSTPRWVGVFENMDPESVNEGKRMAMSFLWKYLSIAAVGISEPEGYPGYKLVAHCHTPKDVTLALQGKPVVVH